jgi:ABC-type tungstate transport system permease subunit
MKKFVVLILALLIFSSTTAVSAETRIRMASTTSTQNSGLFDYLLPLFEKKTGIKVDVVAVGTGASIEIGKRGDADIVFVHAREQELKAVEEGYFVNRHDVMYNDFVVIGPANDQQIRKRSIQKDRGERVILRVPRRQVRHAYERTRDLEKVRHRTNRSKMVP